MLVTLFCKNTMKLWAFSWIHGNVLTMAWVVTFVNVQYCVYHKYFHTSLYREAKVQWQSHKSDCIFDSRNVHFPHGTQNDRPSCHSMLVGMAHLIYCYTENVCLPAQFIQSKIIKKYSYLLFILKVERNVIFHWKWMFK